MLVDGPADHAPRVRVDHRREVEPSFPGAQVGDIADPNLVERADVPLSLHLVNGVAVGAVQNRRRLPSFRAHTDETELAHSLGDGLSRDGLAVLAQVHEDLRGPRNLVGVAVKPRHLRLDPLVAK